MNKALHFLQDHMIFILMYHYQHHEMANNISIQIPAIVQYCLVHHIYIDNCLPLKLLKHIYLILCYILSVCVRVCRGRKHFSKLACLVQGVSITTISCDFVCKACL